ncbi:MAG: FIVAR domain-containing protein, partial [Coriobacteriales bacterium]|nr:FIVAR domain-containing protein [Coriobacteriales bacterium]
ELTDVVALERGYATDATWSALQDAIATGEAVLADANATQTQIDAALAAISAATLALRYDYPILDAFVAWSGTGEARVRIDADRNDFVRLILSNATVAETNYTVTSGSTIITLHEAYLKTLAPGSHAFFAEFSDGSAGPLTLTVKASGGSGGGETSGGGSGGAGGSGSTGSGTSTPATGDSATLLIALVLALLAAATALLVARNTRA